VIRRLVAALVLAVAQIGIAEALQCNVSSAATAFGVYDPNAASSLLTTGSVTIQCDKKFSVVLRAGIGNGAGASYASGRKMTRIGGGATLLYNLYANAARTQVLGDGTAGSVTLVVTGDKHATQSVWGRMPANQTGALAGAYADTVVVTINW